jgi:hypothetical protein
MVVPRASRNSCLALLVLAPMLGAQNGPNQPQPPVQNDLLDQLVGVWAVAGTIRGEPVREEADAVWVLGHQFLRIHRKQLDGPAESIVHVGFDTVLQRFVAFRLDTNGARGGETLGYGVPKGDKLEFDYDYPTSLFRETWSWDAKEKAWQFLSEIQRKNVKGATWSTFSSLTLHSIRVGRGGPGRGFGPQPPHPPSPPQAPPAPQP